MEDPTILALCFAAASIGLMHTILGPDHYIPFVAMGQAGEWSLARTLGITAVCGVGHVAGSVLLGALGVALGWAVAGLEAFEGTRGDLAGWLLLGFGLAYMVWGIYRARRGQAVHEHKHVPTTATMTPWVLFTIFVFGPCEPLIPLLMYPAATLSVWVVALVALIFAIATIGTMLVVVTVGYLGVERLPMAALQRYSHALAGFALFACGAAIKAGL